MKPPKPLKEGEVAIYQANPFYDDVLVFVATEIPTSQDDFKLVDEANQLYKRVSKGNVKIFKEQIQDRLLKKKKSSWPYTEYLAVVITISGPKKYIKIRDIDNFLKTIFDSIKGIVIQDDNLIVKVTVDKQENPFVSGFTIAIRKEFENGVRTTIYGQNSDNWEIETKLKIQNGGICWFDHY